MKKRLFAIILGLVICLNLVGLNEVEASAATIVTTGISTEYDMLGLDRGLSDGNLISNGGFENNGSGWSTTGAGQFTSYTGCAYAGSYCGLLPRDTQNASVYQALTLKKNTEYRVTAKMCFGAVGSQAYVAVKTPTVENLSPAIETVVTCNEGEAWIYKDVTFEFNSGSNTNVTLAFLKWTESTTDAIYTAQVYIDEVSVIEVNGTEESGDEQYEVIWADEFNSSVDTADSNGLDVSNWGYELGCVRGVEQQHYTKENENVHVTDGKLILEVTNRAEEDRYTNPRGSRQVIYNSGSVRTHGKQEFLFGRIEILAKLPSGQATFPAFWTLGADFTLDGCVNEEQGDIWPLCGEIDIMESIGNAGVVYQTLHYSDTTKTGYTEGADNGTYAGNGQTTSITTAGQMIDGETYHVFGINWSPGKMEWYIDDQIVRTVDYSNDAAALAALDRPQYIQLNFATGGNWPGNAGSDLAGKTFKVEYAYYAQNEEQKAAAEEYYANTVSISANDITISKGNVPDLLSNVILNAGSDAVDTGEYTIDYSIDNEYMFTTSPDLNDNSTSNDEARTKVECLISSVSEKENIADLPVGEYNIHYSAMHDSKPSTRKTVKLTIVE